MKIANPQWPVWSIGQVVQRLPPVARRKLASLEAQLADHDALERNAHARHVALEEAIMKADYRLGNLHPSENAEDIAELNDEIALLRSDLLKVDNERSARSASKANLTQVLSELKNWLGLQAEHLSALRVVTVEARPRDRETLADAIRRVRDAIGDKFSAIAQVRAAPLPADEARARIIDQIDAAARRGRPHLSLESGKAEVRFPDEPAFANPGQPIGAPTGSASALACWLWRDEMIEALTSGLEDVDGAVPSAERPQREAKLKLQLLYLEREEEALIEQAIEAKLDAHRRPTANPLAVLGLEYATVYAADAAE